MMRVHGGVGVRGVIRWKETNDFNGIHRNRLARCDTDIMQ